MPLVINSLRGGLTDTTCMHTHTHTHTHTHARTHAHAHTRMHAHARMHTHTYSEITAYTVLAYSYCASFHDAHGCSGHAH